jgi:hypothetical protein
MNDNDQLEFTLGENEQPVTVEMSEDGSGAKVQEQESLDIVQTSSQEGEAEELEQYSEKVKKRIDKLTARLRETQRREQAALEYARGVQQQSEEMRKVAMHSDLERFSEAKSRIETQSIALKQIIKKAREEGDIDTETEAQERLTTLIMEQRRVQEADSQRAVAVQRFQQNAQTQQNVQQQPQRQQPPPVDPRAEEWAEKNEWFGSDNVMTHTAYGIHRQLVEAERFDPSSDEYYDELDRRLAETFPTKIGKGRNTQNTRNSRPVQTVAPATRSSGANNVRRTVRLTPSQVAIAKKLGVPLEEYAKYVKE